MNNYFFAGGALALIIAVGGPQTAAARTYDAVIEVQDDSDIQVTSIQAEVEDESSSAGTVSRPDDETSSDDRQSLEVRRQESRAEATSSDDRKDEDGAESEARDEMEIEIELEDDSETAASLDDLKLKIETRRQELDDEEASTTPRFKEVMENANEVRLAVHALLASKDLIGGIGPQVSEIAKAMNDSVATTTNAEAKIQSRGFLTRLLFGGDRSSAEAISKEVERNQEGLAKLTELLERANLSLDMQATLAGQIAALKEAQERLQALAQRERSRWGLFSWRIFGK